MEAFIFLKMPVEGSLESNKLGKKILVPTPSKDFPNGFVCQLTVPESQSLREFLCSYETKIRKEVQDHGVVLAQNVGWGDTPEAFNTPAPDFLYSPPHVDGTNRRMPNPWTVTALTLRPDVNDRDPTQFAPTREWEEQIEKQLKGHNWRVELDPRESLWSRVSRELSLLQEEVTFGDGAENLKQFKGRTAAAFEQCPVKWSHLWKPNTALFYGTAFTLKGDRVLHARLTPRPVSKRGAMKGWNIV